MEIEKILEDVNVIFEEVLDVDSLQIDRTTTADDIDEWDSLSHIQLVVAVEKHFKIKFTAKEILSWANVGDMLDTIQQKVNAK